MHVWLLKVREESRDVIKDDENVFVERNLSHVERKRKKMFTTDELHTAASILTPLLYIGRLAWHIKGSDVEREADIWMTFPLPSIKLEINAPLNIHGQLCQVVKPVELSIGYENWTLVCPRA